MIEDESCKLFEFYYELGGVNFTVAGIYCCITQAYGYIPHKSPFPIHHVHHLSHIRFQNSF